MWAMVLKHVVRGPVGIREAWLEDPRDYFCLPAVSWTGKSIVLNILNVLQSLYEETARYGTHKRFTKSVCLE
jgi:hypothetical protein